MKKTCFCGISERCGYQVEIDMEQHDKVIFEDGYNKAIDDYVKALKPIIDDKIKGWTNSDDLIRWCENSIDKVAEQLKNERSRYDD